MALTLYSKCTPPSRAIFSQILHLVLRKFEEKCNGKTIVRKIKRKKTVKKNKK